MRPVVLATLFACALAPGTASGQEPVRLVWERLPNVPVQEAGPVLYGVHGGALVALSGRLHVLAPGAQRWDAAAGIPEPDAYVAAASAEDGAWLLPGEDAETPFARLTWDGGRLAADFPPVEPERAAALRETARRAEEGRALLGAGHELRVMPPGGLHLTNSFTGTGFSPGALPGDAAWGPDAVLLAAGKRPVFVTGDGRVYLGAFPRAAASSLNGLDYAVILLYLGVLVAMGWHFSRRESDTAQYFLGGRRVPWWAVGLSIFGTSLSAITYLSIPARAFATNWVYFNANIAVFLVAPVVTLFYLGHYRRWPITTAYEYLELRFNLVTRIYGSLCFMIFQVGRVGIVMLLPAIALSAATGMDRFTCILVMGALATLYTVMGGIEAVIWTDVVQSAVLAAGALLALLLVVWNVDGGAAGIVRDAAANGKLHFVDWGWDPTSAVLWVVLIGNAFMNLYPMTADQTVVQRYLSTADEKQAARAVWTNALLTVPVTVLFFSLGTALWAYFRQHPEWLNPVLENDAVLPLFVTLEFPMGMRGILIAGIFAAAMSSLDSSINSVASVLVNDYYRRFVPRVTERGALAAARATTLVFGAVGTASALYAARLDAVSLWDPFLSLLSYVGSGIAGVFALGVFTRRAHGTGAVAGAAASALAIYSAGFTGMHDFAKAIVGVLTALCVGYLVSLATPGLRKDLPVQS